MLAVRPQLSHSTFLGPGVQVKKKKKDSSAGKTVVSRPPTPISEEIGLSQTPSSMMGGWGWG